MTMNPIHQPIPPQWTRRIVTQTNDQLLHTDRKNIQLKCRTDRKSAALITASGQLPPHPSAGQVHQATVDAYHAIFNTLAQLPGMHIARFWNFIPDLLNSDDHGRQLLYMHFNAARAQVFKAVDYLKQTVNRRPAPASGIGSPDQSLTIIALATTQTITPMENPDQCPTDRYGKQFGHQPPLFSRAATLYWPNDPTRMGIIASGTAAITGRDSLHPNDLTAQTNLTCHHLATLIRIAEKQPKLSDRQALAAYQHLRIYLPNPADRQQVSDDLQRLLPAPPDIEWLNVPLCRPELLIEIEAVANLPQPDHLKDTHCFFNNRQAFSTNSLAKLIPTR